MIWLHKRIWFYEKVLQRWYFKKKKGISLKFYTLSCMTPVLRELSNFQAFTFYPFCPLKSMSCKKIQTWTIMSEKKNIQIPLLRLFWPNFYIKCLIKFLSNFSSICEKVQTPWTIRFFVVKNASMKTFLWSKKHKCLDLATT